MDITKKEVTNILGAQDNPEDPAKFAKPLTKARRKKLHDYIEMHEKKESFVNSDGKVCLKVYHRIVNLEKGAGFGELALMSVSSRMSTCRAMTDCTLGTLNRNDFSTILKKAQKRKIYEKIRFF